MDKPDVVIGEIIEEAPTDQRIVPFMGDNLVAALTAPGDIYVSLNGMCKALGLNRRGQEQRILRTGELAAGLRRIPLATRGGAQKMNCLRIDKIGLWLAGVESDRVKGPFAAKIRAYHKELAPEATRIFLRVVGLVPPSAPVPADLRIQQLEAQYADLMAAANLMREHLEALRAVPAQLAVMDQRLDQALHLWESFAGQQHAIAEQHATTEQRVDKIDARTQQLSPASQRQVRAFVEHIVTTTKKRAHPLEFSYIYRQIQRRFNVGSYSQVADDMKDDLMQFLDEMLRQATQGELPEQGQLFG